LQATDDDAYGRDDGLLITDLYEKPGFVSVMGGSFTKPKEMSCEEAEIYKENHIRVKFGLERTDEMPRSKANLPKRVVVATAIKPSLFSCRSNYCSRHARRNIGAGTSLFAG